MITQRHGPIEYFVKGDAPRLLLLSGMHGDEYESSDCLIEYIEQHKDSLPDFLCLPRLSPSAIARKTRKNQWGRDINRQFFDNPEDEEVQAIMQILRPYQFPLSINVHEDPDRLLSFYLYDSDCLTEDQLTHLRTTISATGARLYTGIDDPEDIHLGLEVKRGYVSTPFDESHGDTGFSERWLVKRRIVKRMLVPEIPGKAPIELKKKLVEAIFSFALPLLPQS